MADSAPKDRVELNAIPTSKEAGVTEAVELYMRAEEIYVGANASLSNPRTTPTSNSTNWDDGLPKSLELRVLNPSKKYCFSSELGEMGAMSSAGPIAR